MPKYTYHDRYGPEHRAARKRWKPVVDSGQAKCARCSGVIAPGTRWALDHTDDGTAYLGPSHMRCNGIASNGKYQDPKPKLSTVW